MLWVCSRVRELQENLSAGAVAPRCPKRWVRLRAGLDPILDQRRADMADLPGGASGSLVRGYKGKEADRLVTRIDPGVVSLVAERCRLRGNVDRRNLARFSFLIAVRSWIAALKGLASEIRFRPSRHSLTAAVDLDEHEAHVVAETPKTQEKVSGFVERMQAEERSATVAPN
jgi:hypothetical protein